MTINFERGFSKVDSLPLCANFILSCLFVDVPGPPINVQLHVTSNRSLMVTFSEPDEINHASVTRYKSKSCITNTLSCSLGHLIMHISSMGVARGGLSGSTEPSKFSIKLTWTLLFFLDRELLKARK